MRNFKNTLMTIIPVVLLIVSFIGAQFLLVKGSTDMALEREGEPKMTNRIDIKTVTMEEFSMNYFKFGSGDENLVILPGLSVQSVMGLADMVADSYASMADNFTVYVFDRRNELPESYTMADMARDTAEVIRALKIGPVCLFGASQGGMMALEIAAEYPELVKSMVVGSTTACVGDEQYQLFEKWIELAKEGDAEALYLAFGKAIYTEEVFEASRQLLIDAAQTVTSDDFIRFIILAQSVQDFDITGKLDRITCPVLVLGSNDDEVVGGDASGEIAEHLTNSSVCQIHMYDGYGHASYDTAPDYRERTLQFFLTNGGV